MQKADPTTHHRLSLLEAVTVDYVHYKADGWFATLANNEWTVGMDLDMPAARAYDRTHHNIERALGDFLDATGHIPDSEPAEIDACAAKFWAYELDIVEFVAEYEREVAAEVGEGCGYCGYGAVECGMSHAHH